jgi:hypothetical protein
MRSRSIRSPLDARKHVIRFARTLARRRVSRRALCCVLVINLFVWPGLHITLPDLSAWVAGARAAATAPFDEAKLLFKKLFGPRPGRQETAADRLSHVSHITLNPPKHVLYQQQRLPFISLATDNLGRTIQGVRFDYSSSDTSKLTVDEMGVVTALHPGQATLPMSQLTRKTWRVSRLKPSATRLRL